MRQFIIEIPVSFKDESQYFETIVNPIKIINSYQSAAGPDLMLICLERPEKDERKVLRVKYCTTGSQVDNEIFDMSRDTTRDPWTYLTSHWGSGGMRHYYYRIDG